MIQGSKAKDWMIPASLCSGRQEKMEFLID